MILIVVDYEGLVLWLNLFWFLFLLFCQGAVFRPSAIPQYLAFCPTVSGPLIKFGRLCYHTISNKRMDDKEDSRYCFEGESWPFTGLHMGWGYCTFFSFVESGSHPGEWGRLDA